MRIEFVKRHEKITQNFTGAQVDLVVNSPMIKSALFVMAGLFALGHTLSAQTQTDYLALNQSNSPALSQADMFTALNADYGFPSLALSERQLFSFARAFNWVEATPPDFLPAFSNAELPETSPRVTTTQGSVSKVVMVQPDPIYASGEVGALYGRSTGKFGREVEQGFILGEVGNDKFQVTAGAFYQESNGRVPRWGR